MKRSSVLSLLLLTASWLGCLSANAQAQVSLKLVPDRPFAMGEQGILEVEVPANAVPVFLWSQSVGTTTLPVVGTIGLEGFLRYQFLPMVTEQEIQVDMDCGLASLGPVHAQILAISFAGPVSVLGLSTVETVAADLALEGDCNENGMPDSCELADGSEVDVNSNLIPDSCEDCDGDGLLDELELDCNLDGVPDDCEIGDCNANGIPDVCEPDCDLDGIADACESDVNGNGIVDDCEDCDGDGRPNGLELDGDGDGLPDDCEGDCDGDGVNEAFDFLDCDVDGVPDACEILGDSTLDLDGDGVLDACGAILFSRDVIATNLVSNEEARRCLGQTLEAADFAGFHSFVELELGQTRTIDRGFVWLGFGTTFSGDGTTLADVYVDETATSSLEVAVVPADETTRLHLEGLGLDPFLEGSFFLPNPYAMDLDALGPGLRFDSLIVTHAVGVDPLPLLRSVSIQRASAQPRAGRHFAKYVMDAGGLETDPAALSSALGNDPLTVASIESESIGGSGYIHLGFERVFTSDGTPANDVFVDVDSYPGSSGYELELVPADAHTWQVLSAAGLLDVESCSCRVGRYDGDAALDLDSLGSDLRFRSAAVWLLDWGEIALTRAWVTSLDDTVITRGRETWGELPKEILYASPNATTPSAFLNGLSQVHPGGLSGGAGSVELGFGAQIVNDGTPAFELVVRDVADGNAFHLDLLPGDAATWLQLNDAGLSLVNGTHFRVPGAFDGLTRIDLDNFSTHELRIDGVRLATEAGSSPTPIRWIRGLTLSDDQVSYLRSGPTASVGGTASNLDHALGDDPATGATLSGGSNPEHGEWSFGTEFGCDGTPRADLFVHAGEWGGSGGSYRVALIPADAVTQSALQLAGYTSLGDYAWEDPNVYDRPRGFDLDALGANLSFGSFRVTAVDTVELRGGSWMAAPVAIYASEVTEEWNPEGADLTGLLGDSDEVTVLRNGAWVNLEFGTGFEGVFGVNDLFVDSISGSYLIEVIPADEESFNLMLSDGVTPIGGNRFRLPMLFTSVAGQEVQVDLNCLGSSGGWPLSFQGIRIRSDAASEVHIRRVYVRSWTRRFGVPTRQYPSRDLGHNLTTGDDVSTVLGNNLYSAELGDNGFVKVGFERAVLGDGTVLPDLTVHAFSSAITDASGNVLMDPGSYSVAIVAANLPSYQALLQSDLQHLGGGAFLYPGSFQNSQAFDLDALGQDLRVSQVWVFGSTGSTRLQKIVISNTDA